MGRADNRLQYDLNNAACAVWMAYQSTVLGNGRLKILLISQLCLHYESASFDGIER